MSKARAQRRNAPVAGGLIEYAVACDRLGKDGGVGRLDDLEGIKAGAHKKQELIAQNVAGGAQLTAKAVLLAQLPRLAIGAPVLEVGEHQRHQGELIEIRG